MDSLRKRPTVPVEHTTKYAAKPQVLEQRQQKKEALYISHQEAQQMDKRVPKPKKNTGWFKKILKSILAVFLLAAFCYGIYFFGKIFLISKKMNLQSPAKTTLAEDVRDFMSPIVPAVRNPLKGEDSGRINILLLGAAGEHKPGGNLTDTIMIMSIDLKNNKVALLSLPRDFYVPLATTNTFTKINSLYPLGIKKNQGAELVRSTIEKITGITLNYYLAVDFEGFQKIIDDIGGVNITNERDIFDPTYPGPNYSYQTFTLSKGFHTLDGETALKYVRERHDDPEGDFGRAKRQQQVIQAVKNKAFSLQTFFNAGALNNVLNTLGDNIKTDITFGEIDQFITLSKKLDLQNITNVVVDAWKPDSLMKVSHVNLGGVNAFVLVPRVGNYSEIQDLAQNIFDQDQIKMRAKKIAEEDAHVEIINASGSSGLAIKIENLLEDKLGIKNVKIVFNKNEQPQQQTTVTDFSSSSKIFTLDELIKKIPARIISHDNVSQQSNANKTENLASGDATSELPNDADIVLTLGSDIIDTYKYDDVSKDDYDKAQSQQEFDLPE